MAFIIKQLLDSVFVISGIIKVSVSDISLSLRLRLITLITKTSSNNCLKFALFFFGLRQIDNKITLFLTDILNKRERIKKRERE